MTTRVDRNSTGDDSIKEITMEDFRRRVSSSARSRWMADHMNTQVSSPSDIVVIENIKGVLKNLELVTTEEAERSLETVCDRIRMSFASLQHVQNNLIQKAFTGLQTINSAIGSGKVKKDELLFLRILVHIKNQHSDLLTIEKLNEIDAMVECLMSLDGKWRNQHTVPEDSSMPNLDSRRLIFSRKHNTTDEFIFEDNTLKRQRISDCKDLCLTPGIDGNIDVGVDNKKMNILVSEELGKRGSHFNEIDGETARNGSLDGAPTISTSDAVGGAPTISTSAIPALSGCKDLCLTPGIGGNIDADDNKKTNILVPEELGIGSSHFNETDGGTAQNDSVDGASTISTSATVGGAPTISTSAIPALPSLLKDGALSTTILQTLIRKVQESRAEPYSKIRVEAAVDHRIIPNSDILPERILENDGSLKNPMMENSDVHQLAGKTVSGETVFRGTRKGVCKVGVSRELQSSADVDEVRDLDYGKQKYATLNECAQMIKEQNNQFKSRKLCLIVNLDQTLLQSVKYTEVETYNDILRYTEQKYLNKPGKHLFYFPEMGLWIKLRPGIWNFLEKASKLFELYIYTMGNKMYATEIAKVLDPHATLFGGQVTSWGGGKPTLNSDLHIESSVLIMDNSTKTWKDKDANLIVIERYRYFPSMNRQIGLPGRSFLETGRDESQRSGALASSLVVIENIHKRFFSDCNTEDVDVRKILTSEQRKVLAGCKILFSGIFPIGETSPHRHTLWMKAKQFGADCTNQIEENVTHVVANEPGTHKVKWARSLKKFVVRPGWVEASALFYCRAKENDFVV